MLCEEVVNRLWEYLDRELAPEEAAIVTAHLDCCPHCYPVYCCDRAFLDLLARVRIHCRAPEALVHWARRLT